MADRASGACPMGWPSIGGLRLPRRSIDSAQRKPRQPMTFPNDSMTDTMSDSGPHSPFHATTILMVRKGGRVVIGGDGQVSLGQTVIKGNARKVRRLGKGDVISGFAGATADAFTLFERLEAKLEQYPGQLTRACVELAKDWRTDRYLRRLEAMLIVADKATAFTLSGAGD